MNAQVCAVIMGFGIGCSMYSVMTKKQAEKFHQLTTTFIFGSLAFTPLLLSNSDVKITSTAHFVTMATAPTFAGLGLALPIIGVISFNQEE